jgi:hypothetical protein
LLGSSLSDHTLPGSWPEIAAALSGFPDLKVSLGSHKSRIYCWSYPGGLKKTKKAKKEKGKRKLKIKKLTD